MKPNKLSLVIFTLLLIALATQSPLNALVGLILIVFGFLIVMNPQAAFILILTTKPIIDTTWSFKIPVVGLTLLQIIGVAFPIITFLIVYVKKVPLLEYKNIGLFLIFVLLNVLSYTVFIINIGLERGSNPLLYFVSYIGAFFQFLNSFAAFIILPYLFKDEKDRKRLLASLIIASFFPLITGYLQYFGFIQGRLLRTSGDLIRLSGFYYDSTNLRMYSLQAIIVIFIYLGDYLKHTDKYYRLKRIGCALLIPLFLFLIYKGYSKAALGIVLSWILVYTIMRKRLFEGTMILALVLGMYFLNDNVSSEIERLFNKEIKYSEGTLNPENDYTLLGGRIKTWQFYFADFLEQDFSNQMIGYYFSVGGTVHNDFFRILLANGIIGLCIYIVFLIILLLNLIRSYLAFSDNLSLASVMLFAALIIDSLGLVPLLYPGYCWITFGLISLSLHRKIYIQNNELQLK